MNAPRSGRVRIVSVPLLAAALSLTAAAQKQIDFNRDVRPILSDKCFACHGPDEQHRMVGLRLDTREGAFAERPGGPVIVPGDAKASRLYQRLAHEKPALRMPPPASNLDLTEAQIETIRQWIDSGAPWQMHWAYVPPARTAAPAVSDARWVRNPIDAFVLARLDREGLKPSPEADRVTLLRRLTLDLTGLPPAPAEVDAFLKDKSPEAYEKAVERLLASPHFGERMALPWLDLSRYADTHGYHIDSLREMHHWRDWVIRAFNRNMPFDKFVVEQMAGDLLPDATLEQKLATGFNRNHMINYEGGAIPEEYHNEYVVDRVETTATVFMGMTMGCARCHDHKYDPISQRDFYRFYAFFNTIPEKGLDGIDGNAQPMLPLPSGKQAAELARLKQAIAARQAELVENDVAAAEMRWDARALETLPAPSTEGLITHFEFEDHLADTSGGYQHAKPVRGQVTYARGRLGRAAEFSGETHVELGSGGSFDTKDAFSLAFFLRPNERFAHPVINKRDPETGQGYTVGLAEALRIPGRRREAQVVVTLAGAEPRNAIQAQTKGWAVLGQWTHVGVVYDGSGRASGLRVYLDGKLQELNISSDTLDGSIRTSGPLETGNKKQGRPYKGSLDELRVYARALEAAEVEALAVHQPMRLLLAKAPEKRTCDEVATVRDYFLTWHAPARFREAHLALKTLTKDRDELEKKIPTTMIMAEMPAPRDTYILARGDYRNKGDKVAPGVPSNLPPLPSGAPANRLGLAQWLVDPGHPLTARVTVNRFWQTLFGLGLVETAEDFGSQGSAPSHPELLDWLAAEFVGSGWDVKRMMRLLVTSSTYRQASNTTPDLLEHDPQNRLLARGPRFRLPAELVRDNALAAAGLLDSRIGGPSVFPYQPAGLWEEMAYGDNFTAQEYTPSTGRDLYRRTMYTFWKRTVPPASLATFDAPDREKCVARRARTNTPLQALVLLNDPTYVEAARHLAERMILEGGKDPARRIEHGYRLATARTPTAEERQVIRDIVERELGSYRSSKSSAEALLKVGDSPYNKKLDPAELAAWTLAGSIILNLDETISKE